MTGRNTDIAVYAVLLGTSLLWCGYVVETIPPGTGGGDVGPRAMPLLFGALLGVLAAGLMLNRVLGNDDGEPDTEQGLPEVQVSGTDTPVAGATRNRLWEECLVVTLVFGLLFGYGWALRMIGFNLATFVVIALTMLLCLRERSPIRIAGMSVGVTFFCWLIFGKALNIPLATGIWINLG